LWLDYNIFYSNTYVSQYLLDYDKLFFNIFKKNISMKNRIINLFCRSSKREEATREDENKLNYISSYLLKYLKHYTNNPI